MIKACEKCWETYDTEKRGANDFFCPKCNKQEVKNETS